MRDIKSQTPPSGPRSFNSIFEVASTDMEISSVILISIFLLIKGGPVSGEVHQSPASLEAAEGEAVELNCRFDEPRNVPELVTFQWNLPAGEVYRVVPGGETTGGTSGRVALRTDLGTRSSTLRLSNTGPNDSGVYVCVIQLLEPLPIIQMEGSGTQLRVVRGNAKHQNTNEPTVVGDLPGNVKHQETNESKVVADMSGNVKHQNTTESKVIAHLSVGAVGAAERNTMELWGFVSLLSVVGVTLIGGLGFSIWSTCSFSGTDPADERCDGTLPGAQGPSTPTNRVCRAAWVLPQSV
ncbi:uncharacterized protein [Heptranchias perlo]|uniref:uncharacterized protein n=1 Tax=Heptranchias perlo TaxID=212740 RepID=UPI00355A264B